MPRHLEETDTNSADCTGYSDGLVEYLKQPYTDRDLHISKENAG